MMSPKNRFERVSRANSAFKAIRYYGDEQLPNIMNPLTDASDRFPASATRSAKLAQFTLEIRTWLLAPILAALFLPAFPAAQSPVTAVQSNADSRIVQELLALIEGEDFANSPFENPRAATMEEVQSLRKRGKREDLLRANMLEAKQLLFAGRTPEAIRIFEALRDRVAKDKLAGPRFSRRVDELLAVAYMRSAEQANCLAHHNPDSCLMPIQGAGKHEIPEGSEKAFAQLKRCLQRTPDSVASRWLLNLAAMTLGRHPSDIPPKWLVPESTFDSQYPLPRFRDVAISAGVSSPDRSGGCVLEDLDGDGDLDLVTSSSGIADQLRCFQNNGDGSFRERSVEAGLRGQIGGLNLTSADYDNDGDFDLLILRGGWLGDTGSHPNSLLENDGYGVFRDVTHERGIYSRHPTQTAAWGDYDNDGWLDVFIGNESTKRNPAPCEMYHSLANGNFEEVGAELGVDVIGVVKGSTWGDIDDDGDVDLFVSNYGRENSLFRNDGVGVKVLGLESESAAPWKFVDIAEAAGVTGPEKSFPTWFWDFDQDGDLDLLVASYPSFMEPSLSIVASEYLGEDTGAETLRVFRNIGGGQFANATQAVGLDHVMLTMGAGFGDLDNDGYPDAYFGTGQPDLACLVPNRMFRNDAGQGFQDVTTAGGFGHLQKGHGIAFGDMDNDGDQDVYAVLGGAYSGDVYPNSLFENPGNENNWLTLRLAGSKSNRAGVGARIEVRVLTKSGAKRSVYGLVAPGSSFGAGSYRQELGLGRASSIESVIIHWPSGTVSLFAGPELDAFYLAREDATELVKLDRKPIALDSAASDQAVDR